MQGKAKRSGGGGGGGGGSSSGGGKRKRRSHKSKSTGGIIGVGSSGGVVNPRLDATKQSPLFRHFLAQCQAEHAKCTDNACAAHFIGVRLPADAHVGYVDGEARMRVHHLHAGSNSQIGRTPNNEVHIECADNKTVQMMVSRAHARVLRSRSALSGRMEWKLFDIGSLNGTYVEKSRVQECVLSDGVLVTFGAPPLQANAELQYLFLVKGCAHDAPPCTLYNSLAAYEAERSAKMRRRSASAEMAAVAAAALEEAAGDGGGGGAEEKEDGEDDEGEPHGQTLEVAAEMAADLAASAAAASVAASSPAERAAVERMRRELAAKEEEVRRLRAAEDAKVAAAAAEAERRAAEAAEELRRSREVAEAQKKEAEAERRALAEQLAALKQQNEALVREKNAEKDQHASDEARMLREKTAREREVADAIAAQKARAEREQAAAVERAKSTMVDVAAMLEQLTCIICHELMEDPACLPCAHSFCFACIDSWLQQSPSNACCPVCRTAAKRTQLARNLVLKNIIRDQAEREKKAASTEDASAASDIATKTAAPAAAPARVPARTTLATTTGGGDGDGDGGGGGGAVIDLASQNEEASAVARLQRMIADARANDDVFLSIFDEWDAEGRLEFATGVAEYHGEARKLYCSTVDLTKLIIQNMSKEQLQRAMRNVGLNAAGLDVARMRRMLRRFLWMNVLRRGGGGDGGGGVDPEVIVL